jgi:dTDP-4-dehydrorhamnose 3,5-epimerase
MNFHPTDIDGAYLIEWEPFDDERGYFARTRSNEEFAALGLSNDLSECSVSFNKLRGTLRGMHYQAAPHEETKLVMCVGGLVFDALVDLRPNSKTYLNTCSAELSLANRRMLYVPAGVAHGFITLEDASYVQYQIGGDYVPDAGRGVRWNDPSIAVSWPESPVLISTRDAGYALLDPRIESK